jgi:ATP-dependent DNA helicase RecQ
MRPSIYPPTQLAMQLSYKHVWLDYFDSRQKMISQLNSGDLLSFNGETCFNTKGVAVLKVSKFLKEQIEPMMRRNYRPHSAKVRFIVYWRKEDADDEIIIVLPEIYFEKTEASSPG